MNILLINPAYFTEKITTTMEDVHLAMERKPPLGLLSISAYLREHSDHDVTILDNQLEQLDDTALEQYLLSHNPDVVGVTVVSFKLWEAFQVSTLVRRVLPEAHITWGGPHLAIYPEESLALDCVDSIVLDDGETPTMELCDHLEKGESLEGITGLYTQNTLPVSGEYEGAINPELDELPFLDLQEVPYERYTAYLTGDRMATLLTSRGCPFRCIFCRLDTRKIRLQSVDRVIEQIKRYVALGVREVEFYDETFNITTARVKEFAEKLLAEKIDIRWSFRGRIDQVDREMLQAIKAAGCQRIQYGVESGSDRVLDKLRKGTKVSDIRRCFQLTNEVGIDTVAYLILGSPGETMDDMQQTIDLVREVRPTYIEYAIFNLSPGTQAYKMALEEGVIASDIWREYAANPTAEMPVLTWDKDFSARELEAVRNQALKSFYINPRYIIHRLVNMRPAEAAMTFKTGIGFLKKLVFSA